MKMTQNKETTDSNNKNDINDIKSENIEIENKTVSRFSCLSKSGEHNLTSVNVFTKTEETDSDDEPLLKKFEKELKNFEKKEKEKEKETEKETEKENETEKEKENGEEKNNKNGSGYDDRQHNNNVTVSKQEIISSDDECLLDLVKREYTKKMNNKSSSADSVSTYSIDSDEPILSKCKKNFIKKEEKEILANPTNSTGNSSLNNILQSSNVSNENINIKHMETVTPNRSGSNSYSTMYNNPPSKEVKTERCDQGSNSITNSSSNNNSNNNNNNSTNNNTNNNNNNNKSKVQKSIKKTPNKTPNKTPRKRNTTNSSNNNNDNKNNDNKSNTNNSTPEKRKTTTKSTKTKNTKRSIKRRKKTTKRKKTKRKTKPKAKSTTKKDTTKKKTTAKKTKGRATATRKTTKSSKSKDANYNNLENDSIVIGNFDPHNRSNKEKLVAQLLIRWWYVLPEWPPADYNYEEELKKRKLKLVPLEAYENEEDIDENGFRKVYQISAFPGIFRDAVGTAYDLRDKDTCPSFNNFMKKSDLELLDLICQAIKNQLKCLKNSVYDESTNEKRLEKELKDVEAKLNKLIKKGKNVDKGNEVMIEEQITA